MAVNNSLANRPQRMDFAVYLTQDAAKQQINKLLGGRAGTRFISSLVSAVQANPVLQECTNPSLLSAALQGEALHLSPSPQLGQYYMVPYDNRNKGVKEAQFQIGYKGYIQLAVRSGQYRKINVLAVKEGELEYFDPLQEEIKVNLMIDRWDEREAAPTAGYYAMFELVNGFRKAMYWSRKQMLSHADQYSKAFHLHAVEGRTPKASRVSYVDYLAGKYPKEDAWKYSSFWYTNFDGMAYKTMLRQLISKWGPMSIDMQEAYDADMSVIGENGIREHVDSDPGTELTLNAAEDLEASISQAQGKVPGEEGISQEAPEGVEILDGEEMPDDVVSSFFA